MQFIEGRTLHESYISGELGIDEWRVIFHRLRDIIDVMGRYRVRADADSITDMYVGKTIDRLSALRDHPMIGRFFEEAPVINGRRYKPINEVIDSLEDSIRRLSPCYEFTMIHGDFHFGNIIRDEQGGLFMVDPRGRFGSHMLYGDPRYDMAKLYHSIEGGYDYIIEDMFYLDTSDGIDYGLDVPEYGFDMMKVMRETFDYCERDVRLIESLLFLSMIPLHSESVDRQMVMFARGMELFGRVMG